MQCIWQQLTPIPVIKYLIIGSLLKPALPVAPVESVCTGVFGCVGVLAVFS